MSDEKIIAALELFRQLQEPEQITFLETLQRLSAGLEPCPAAPE